MTDNTTIISVSQLNFYLKTLIDGDNNIANLFICGEVSNIRKQYSSGHIYFTLKDDRSTIPAIIFKSYAQNIDFEFKEGERVICVGKTSVYEKDTKIQLYVKQVYPFGIGNLYIAYNKLKDQLEKEGYFDQNNKKDLPSFPKNVAVLTSESGSVIHDIYNITSRRFPLATLNLIDIPVQGNNVEKIISQKLTKCDKSNKFDVIIIARGGGSFEDFSPFNSFELAKAIFDCNTPIVSAIGHETDFTICDFVSDLRAPTPSAAAELIFPDINDILNKISQTKESLYFQTKQILEQKSFKYKLINNSFVLNNSEQFFETKYKYLQQIKQQLFSEVDLILNINKNAFINFATRLNDLNPLSVLLRGYSITSKDSSTISSIKQINKDDKITIDFFDGKANCCVLETECNNAK